MNKAAILKIAGILIVPFILMMVGAFFLYPYLNEEKYDEIKSNFDSQQEEEFDNSLQASNSNRTERNISTAALSDSAGVDMQGDLLSDSLQITGAGIDIQKIQDNEIRLHGMIDSLYSVIDRMEIKIDSLQNPVEQKRELDPAEFTERVKSLLNLEEEELSPILTKMTREQIVRLYNGAGTLQRQKILRSLSSDKAAELMTEIML